MASGDEFLDLILTQAEKTNELLGQLLDRIPAPAPAGAGPGRVDIREPLPETHSVPASEPQPAAVVDEPATDEAPPAAKAAPRKAAARRRTTRTQETEA